MKGHKPKFVGGLICLIVASIAACQPQAVVMYRLFAERGTVAPSMLSTTAVTLVYWSMLESSYYSWDFYANETDIIASGSDLVRWDLSKSIVWSYNLDASAYEYTPVIRIVDAFYVLYTDYRTTMLAKFWENGTLAWDRTIRSYVYPDKYTSVDLWSDGEYLFVIYNKYWLEPDEWGLGYYAHYSRTYLEKRDMEANLIRQTTTFDTSGMVGMVARDRIFVIKDDGYDYAACYDKNLTSLYTVYAGQDTVDFLVQGNYLYSKSEGNEYVLKKWSMNGELLWQSESVDSQHIYETQLAANNESIYIVGRSSLPEINGYNKLSIIKFTTSGSYVGQRILHENFTKITGCQLIDDQLCVGGFDDNNTHNTYEKFVRIGLARLDESFIDSDGDGLPNMDEEEIYFTNSLLADTDGDQLNDGDEIFIYLTDPLVQDTDGDGLSDYDEVYIYHTDPILLDTDGDGYDDSNEISSLTDPLNAYDNLYTRGWLIALCIGCSFTLFLILYRYRGKHLKVHGSHPTHQGWVTEVVYRRPDKGEVDRFSCPNCKNVLPAGFQPGLNCPFCNKIVYHRNMI